MSSYLKESLRQAMEARQERERQLAEQSGEKPAPRPAGIPLGGGPALGRSTLDGLPARTPPPPAPPPPVVQAAVAPPVQVAAAAVAAPLPITDDESEEAGPLRIAIGARATGTTTETGLGMDRPLILAPPPTRFRPLEPKSFEEAGLEASYVEELVVKYLLANPGSTGRRVATSLCLPRQAMVDLLSDMKQAKLLIQKGTTATGDFKYELTELGRNAALDIQKTSRYVGPAPVTLEQYLESVREQSIKNESPHMKDLKRAFQDLVVPERMLQQLGPAMTSGKGLFLFGNPGNGKTSLAERMTRAFGTSVYLPYAVLVEGALIKIFDPMVHEPLVKDEKAVTSKEKTDLRWIKCRRPTVVVGGELTMDSLELEHNAFTGICEAPIQMKANCGTLVIDDFGRQRMDPATLLNRWIVPLEQRVDYLRLPDGRKVQIPFDPLLIFSTNLDPKDLCDEAFLRRIPYKVNVEDPDETSYRRLLHLQAKSLGFEPDEACFDYVIEQHYKRQGRGFRNCHPRDLILQIKNQCVFREKPLVLSKEGFDEAASLYFTLL